MDEVAEFEERHLRLASGRRLAADVVVAAFGLHYQANPAFLAGLGIGAAPSHPTMALAGHTRAVHGPNFMLTIMAAARWITMVPGQHISLSGGEQGSMQSLVLSH